MGTCRQRTRRARRHHRRNSRLRFRGRARSGGPRAKRHRKARNGEPHGSRDLGAGKSARTGGYPSRLRLIRRSWLGAPLSERHSVTATTSSASVSLDTCLGSHQSFLGQYPLIGGFEHRVDNARLHLLLADTLPPNLQRECRGHKSCHFDPSILPRGVP